jgi:hypothetical protein
MDRFHANIYSSCASRLDLGRLQWTNSTRTVVDSSCASRLDLGRLGWLAFALPHMGCMLRDGWCGAGPMDRFHADIDYCYTSRLKLGRLGH